MIKIYLSNNLNLPTDMFDRKNLVKIFLIIGFLYLMITLKFNYNYPVNNISAYAVNNISAVHEHDEKFLMCLIFTSPETIESRVSTILFRRVIFI